MKLCQNFIDNQIKRTWKTPFVDVIDGYVIEKFPTPVFKYDHSDGLGTRGIYHWRQRTFKNAVLDALAMNLNDMLMMKVTPYKLQNHIMLPSGDEKAIEEIIGFLTDECLERKIAITGGETSIHEFFQNELLDISITMSGYAYQMSTNEFVKGDVLVGLASSGLHSNGFTFVRNCGLEFRKEFVYPTKIYNLPNHLGIHGIQHITGGAFTKIKRLLGKGNDAYINKKHFLKPQDIFYEIYKSARKNLNIRVDLSTMYKVFNCGIGMVLSVSPNDVDYIIAFTGGEVIGEVKNGSGNVIIESMFDNVMVTL